VGDYSSSSKSKNLWQVAGKFKIKNLMVMTADKVIATIHDIETPSQATKDALDESITEYVSA
jgi:hypothetical protein